MSILDNFPRLTKRQRLALLYTCSFILNLLFTVPLSAPILVPKANAVSSTVVSTEIIDYYTMSSSQVTSMINIMQAQGIPEITLRLNAFSEWSSGTPSSTGVAKAKEIITEAASQGINVSIDSHTWYTTWDSYFRDTASNYVANRATYIDYVEAMINAFSGYNVSHWMVLNEPQARTASSSENGFISDITSAAKALTDEPVSVRFMGGYSPSTGHYASSLDNEVDFLCRNTYWDPRYPSTTVYGVSQSTMNTMISTAVGLSKDLWITEFGKSNSNQEAQRAYVEAFVAYAKTAGIHEILCWVSKPLGSGESYNLFTGTSPFTPLPAFYELNNDVPPPPPPPPPPPSPTITVSASFTTAPILTNIMQEGFHITHKWQEISASTTIQNYFEDTKFKIIRIQEFRDTNDPCITWNEATHSGTWDWTHVDEILDWCQANNASLMICFLSFTSAGAGSLPGHASATHMHNYGSTGMPNPTEYAYYVEDWAQHIVSVGHEAEARYFEIGNEAWQYYGSSSPDLTKLHNFISLYNAAQAELESHLPGSYVGQDGATLKGVIAEFAAHDCNMTLIDFHKYDTGSTTSTDGYIFRRAEQYFVTTGSYYYSPDDARGYWISHGGASNCIVINSECQLNYAWSPTDDRIQWLQGAVWNSLVLRYEALTGNVSYHIYFDEYATSSPDGFGYICYSPTKLYYGYYPYYWLGNYLGVGDTFRTITSSSVNCRTMAWNDTGGNAYVYLIHNSTSVDTVSVTVTGWNVSDLVSVSKIDNTYPWNNALVQSDSLNATSMSISFNGYGVAILRGRLPGAGGEDVPVTQGTYNFYGALSDADATYTGPILVQVYGTQGNFVNLTVDAGLNQNSTKLNMTNLDYYSWPIGGGAYRRYQVKAGETNFYVFVPDATFAVYNFHVLDYAGTFWTGTSYLRTIKVLDGAERTLEQVRTRSNPLSYDIGVALVVGRNYMIELEDSAGTIYRYDFYASTTTTINLYVNPAVFSDQVKSAYKYVRGQATRSTALTSITMLYQDDLGATSVVNMTVYYQNWTIAYTTSILTPTTEIQSVTWDSANSTTDYRVRITSTHTTFGSMYWDCPLPAAASYLVPIDISFFGAQTWLPWVIPFSLVALTGGVFSTLSTPVGVFAMVGVAAMLKYLGWTNVEWNNIGLAMFVVFLFALTRKKKEEYV